MTVSLPNHPFKDFTPMRVSPKQNVHFPGGWKNGLAGPVLNYRSQEHGLPCIQVIPPAILHGRPNEIDGLDWITSEKKFVRRNW
jgi:hypothetical protein